MHAKHWRPMNSWLLSPADYMCTHDRSWTACTMQAVNEPVPVFLREILALPC